MSAIKHFFIHFMLHGEVYKKISSTFEPNSTIVWSLVNLGLMGWSLSNPSTNVQYMNIGPTLFDILATDRQTNRQTKVKT